MQQASPAIPRSRRPRRPHNRPQRIRRSRQSHKFALPSFRSVSRQPPRGSLAVHSDNAIALIGHRRRRADCPPSVVVCQIAPEFPRVVGALVGGGAEPAAAQLFKALDLPDGREHARTLRNLDRRGFRENCEGTSRTMPAITASSQLRKTMINLPLVFRKSHAHTLPTRSVAPAAASIEHGCQAQPQRASQTVAVWGHLGGSQPHARGAKTIAFDGSSGHRKAWRATYYVHMQSPCRGSRKDRRRLQERGTVGGVFRQTESANVNQRALGWVRACQQNQLAV